MPRAEKSQISTRTRWFGWLSEGPKPPHGMLERKKARLAQARKNGTANGTTAKPRRRAV